MELAKNISEIISFVDILPFCGASLDLVPGSFNLVNGFSLMSRLAVRELNTVFYSFFLLRISVLLQKEYIDVTYIFFKILSLEFV